MKEFVIRDLERFSGIKAHTLRTWEQRYGLPRPQSGPGKTRLYSLNEFGELLNIALLNRNGYKISHLSALNTGAIHLLVKQLQSKDARCEMALNEMFVGMYALDVDIIDAVLDKCFLQLPVHTVFSEIILPFLKKTELLWQGNKLTEEHLVVTAIRKKNYVGN
jgi:DNA-binding transcriptional MerR regulator